MLQTILGAGGVIGYHTALELHRMGIPVRLVSRNPKKIVESDELFSADLLNAEAVDRAVEGSDVVYLTAGLKYDTHTWQDQWPKVMRNTIEACKKHNTKLVFFDNVYCYGEVSGVMSESTPIHASSAKGDVRAKVLDMLFTEMRTGKLNALVARSADFYGPDTPLSFVQVMVFDNLHKGKSPQWMMSEKFLHSFTYTPDAGRATALLGNTEDAYGQTWHLPTDPNTLTGAQFMEYSSKVFGQNKKPTILPKWMLRVLGFFIPAIGESIEMLYQFDRDYVFESNKFFQRYPDFKHLTYQQGIKEIAANYDKSIRVV